MFVLNYPQIYYRKDAEHKSLLVAHIRALNEYLPKHPSSDVSFLGTTEEEISNRWALLSDLIRSSLLKDSNTQGGSNEERKDKRNKKKKQESERNADLMEECLEVRTN